MYLDMFLTVIAAIDILMGVNKNLSL